MDGSAEALRIMVRHLQSEGRDVNEVLKNPALFGGSDAIQQSIYCNRQPVFDYLMKLVDRDLLDLEFVSNEGKTVLHAAASQSRNIHYLDTLLKRGRDPHVECEDGTVPFLTALLSHNFEGARLLVESPQCNKTRLFEEPNKYGYLLFGGVIGMALTNHRNCIGIREIEFLDSISSANFEVRKESGTTVLHILAMTWPSARTDFREFEAWLLDWLLERMPTELINQVEHGHGMAALHVMALRSNDRGVEIMLQNDKVIPCISTAGSTEARLEATPAEIARFEAAPPGMTIFDIALVHSDRDLHPHVILGGAREIRSFQERMTRIVNFLQKETKIPTTRGRYSNFSREDNARGALANLDKRVEQLLALRQSYPAGNVVDVAHSGLTWPHVIS